MTSKSFGPGPLCPARWRRTVSIAHLPGHATPRPTGCAAGGADDLGGDPPPSVALEPDALRGVANEAAARAEACGPWCPPPVLAGRRVR